MPDFLTAAFGGGRTVAPVENLARLVVVFALGLVVAWTCRRTRTAGDLSRDAVTAPVRASGVTRALLGLACVVPAVLCCACGGVSDGVRNRPAGGFPRTTVVNSDGVTATVIPGGEYAASRWRQVFAGEHYRDLWAAPISVPVLDLSTCEGGLTPLRQGGGRQTKSLRLETRDGRQFVFRSVAKDQRNILSATVQATPIADIVQDQVSVINPTGALVVDELAHALGVYHPHPILALAPDDERLGEFRDAFAGRLGVLEEYPVAGVGTFPAVVAAAEIVSTKKLLKNLGKNSSARVNPRSYLTARLLDVLVGDWDRHGDQWRWARRREGGKIVYEALPRDRDQAFALFDGLFPRIAALASVQMEHFSETIDNVPALTHTGRELDRLILADLDKPAWDSVTAAAVAALTDEVIDAAVRRLPQPYHERRGAWLAAALKSRRDQLGAAAASFIALLSNPVDVQFGDESENLVVRGR